MGFGGRSGIPGSGSGPASNVDITAIGGVLVSAQPKTDGQSNGMAVMEVGARAQFYNGVSWDLGRSGFVGVVATYVGFQNQLPYGVHNTVAPVLADGSGAPLQLDASGALIVTTAGGSFSPASVGLVGVAAPASADQAGFVNGAGLLEPARVYDGDSGGGAENVLGVMLRSSAGGGSLELGTLLNPLAVGVVGNVTVLGTVTANQGASAAQANRWPVGLSDGLAFYTTVNEAQLPAALVGGRLDVDVGAWLGSTAPTVGVKAMADSLPVAIATNQSTIPAVNKPDNVNRSATMGVNLGTDPDVSWGASPGNVYAGYCTNKNVAKRYFQTFNKATPPVNGDVPNAEFPVAAGIATADGFTLIGTDFFGTEGTFFSTGVATGYSTTSGTYTAGAASDQVVGIKLT